MKREKVLLCIGVTLFVLWAGTAFGAPVEVVGELKTVDESGGAQGAVVFRDNTKQMTAVSVTGSGTAATAARSDHNHDSRYVNLKEDQTISGDKTFSGQVLSTVVIGAPFAVLSQAHVANLNADLLDGQHSTAFALSSHNHDAIYQKKYGKVAVVATSGGDYDRPEAAMAAPAIASWCGTPSETNPCLLKIMPGVYDVGSSPVVMQPYVDIEGSGEKVTVITGAIADASVPTTGVVRGANNAELRFLTVRNLGVGSYVTGVSNHSANLTMTNVTAIASGATNSNNHGIYNESCSPTMTNVTATASGQLKNYGIRNQSSSPIMTNVTANAWGGTGVQSYNSGVYNASCSETMTMNNVTVTAMGGGESTNNGVTNDSCSLVMTNVTATASGGSNSSGVFNWYSSSPVMTNVTASASGGSNSLGVKNYASSPMMTNVTATASGGDRNYGVDNYSSSPTMANVTSTASGGTYSYGVTNRSSSAVMTNVTATASGGTHSYGVDNFDSGTVKINHSVIKGTAITILNRSGVTTMVGNTQLDGGNVDNTGTLTCVGAYDGNYVALGTNCQ